MSRCIKLLLLVLPVAVGLSPRLPLPLRHLHISTYKATSTTLRASTYVGPGPDPPRVPSPRTPQPRSPLTNVIRHSPVAVSLLYAVDPLPFDEAVASAFNWYCSTPALSQNYMTEAYVASSAFVFWIATFSFFEYFKTGDDSAISWTKLQNYQEWFNPLASYLISIFLYHQFHTHPALPQEPISFSQLSVEVVTGIFLYDVFFYPLHYMLHNFGPIKKFHHYHHRACNIHPVETVQHSYLDGFLQVVVNVLVQQVTPFGGQKHILSRLVHNVLVTYLLTESHLGASVEPTWSSWNLWPEIFSGRHRKHHEGGGKAPRGWR